VTVDEGRDAPNGRQQGHQHPLNKIAKDVFEVMLETGDAPAHIVEDKGRKPPKAKPPRDRSTNGSRKIWLGEGRGGKRGYVPVMWLQNSKRFTYGPLWGILDPHYAGK